MSKSGPVLLKGGMTNPLSSFMVRGSGEVQEAVEPSLPAGGAFLSTLAAPFNPHQTPQQFLVNQSGVTGGLITLPGTGGFLSQPGKVMLQTSASEGFHAGVGEGESNQSEGLMSRTEKVVLQAGAGEEGSFISTEVEEEGKDGGGFVSGTGKVLLQQSGAEEEGGDGDAGFLSGVEKIILQAGEEDAETGVAQGPLLYLDSATGLHVLVHHLPHSTPQQSGPHGEDGSEEQFVVVGALQSEEEQVRGGGAPEPTSTSHLTPLVPLISHQASHNNNNPHHQSPLSSGHSQESGCHVTVENMIRSHIVTTPGNSSEADIAAHQIFEAHLDPPLDLQPHVSPQETPKSTQQPLNTATSLLSVHQGASSSINSQTNDQTLMECSEAPVLTLQVPQVESGSVEIRENILEDVPHITLEEIIEKFASDSQDDLSASSHIAVSSDTAFPSITVLKDASLDHHTTPSQHHTALPPDPAAAQHHRAPQNATTPLHHYKRATQEMPQQQLHRGSQDTTTTTTTTMSQHPRKITRDSTLTMHRQLTQSSYSVRPLSSLSGKSEGSSIRVKVLHSQHQAVLSQNALVAGSGDVGDQVGVDEESLYEVVMTYRCKLCAQVYEEKATLLKHHREVHKPGGAVKIQITTSDHHSTSPGEPPPLVKVATGSNVASITHRLANAGQENEEPRELKILSCGFCSQDFVGVQDFQAHLTKDHPNETSKKNRRGPRHPHGHSDSYPIQPGLLIGHRKARTPTQESPEERRSNAVEVKKRRVRMPKNLHEQYWLQKQKLKPVCYEDVEKNHRCPILPCKYKFSTEETLSLHKECHSQSDESEERGFTCPHCGLKFDKWWMCQMHLWKGHSADVDLLTCGICSTYKTYTRQRLIVHQKIHMDVREHICKVCGKGFRQQSQLLNHQVTHSSHSERPPWKQKGYCTECQRWFGDKKTLKVHISAVHLKLKPHACPHCTYRCARRFDMKVHQRQHSGERPYKCELCGWQCRDHNTLRRHRIIHLDYKPFHCPHDHCMFETRHAPYFKRHMLRQHANIEVVFSCRLCSMETPKLKDYVTHSINHEKELVSDAFSKRSEEVVEGATVGGSGGGRNGKESSSVLFDPQTATDSRKAQVITIKLGEPELQEDNKTANLNPSKRQVQPKQEIAIKDESVDEPSVMDAASSSSGVLSGDEGILSVEGVEEEEEEAVVTLPQVMVAGEDGRQYIIGISHQS